MSRDAAKNLKRALSDARDEAQRKAAALALLRHSLRFGHRRLSLKRLEEAVGCGAALEDEDLHRCAELVLRARDTHMHARLANLSRRLTAVSSCSSSRTRFSCL